MLLPPKGFPPEPLSTFKGGGPSSKVKGKEEVEMGGQTAAAEIALLLGLLLALVYLFGSVLALRRRRSITRPLALSDDHLDGRRLR